MRAFSLQGGRGAGWAPSHAGRPQRPIVRALPPLPDAQARPEGAAGAGTLAALEAAAAVGLVVDRRSDGAAAARNGSGTCSSSSGSGSSGGASLGLGLDLGHSGDNGNGGGNGNGGDCGVLVGSSVLAGDSARAIGDDGGASSSGASSESSSEPTSSGSSRRRRSSPSVAAGVGGSASRAAAGNAGNGLGAAPAGLAAVSTAPCSSGVGRSGGDGSAHAEGVQQRQALAPGASTGAALLPTQQPCSSEERGGNGSSRGSSSSSSSSRLGLDGASAGLDVSRCGSNGSSSTAATRVEAAAGADAAADCADAAAADGAEAAGAGPGTFSADSSPRAGTVAGGSDGASGGVVNGALFPPSERSQIQDSWDALMRWSKFFRRQQVAAASPIEAAKKVVVFGGGSFGTAMGVSLARKRRELDVVLLLRDAGLAADINGRHTNTKYLPDFVLPPNVRATTDLSEAADASYAVHAVPVQHSRAFLEGMRDVLPGSVPIVCVSKGLEVGTGCMMSEVIPSALGRRQPATFISGPSFAREVMEGRPTGVVAASRDGKLAREVQQLFASPCMRVNTSTDVVGVEICGALKNVLAIAAGIVEGLDLGHNALAALVAQGCAEIRWLAEKLGAKPQTMSGLSGLGDIMLTCYGDLSRNRRVGMRLGKGERLEDILASSSQVAEGVATAGVVVSLARRYRVSLPVLTAVAQVLDNNLTPAQAVAEIMNLPQIEEH